MKNKSVLKSQLSSRRAKAYCTVKQPIPYHTAILIPSSISSIHRQSFALLVTFFLLNLVTGCKKYLEVELPKTQLAAKAVFESDATATAVLATIYVRTAEFAGGGTGSVTNLSAYLADETDNYSTTLSLAQLADNQPIASNSSTTSLWNSLYTVIYQSNVLIEGVTNNPKLSPTVANRLKGEALFLRAYAHLTLTSFFGAVPLALTSDYRTNALLARSQPAVVYAQIIDDLKQAKLLLAENFASYTGERIGATHWSASALLARAYLYSGAYENAKIESSAIIASPLFKLLPLSEVFLKNSQETILAYKPAANLQATPEANLFILTAKPSLMALSSKFYNGFEIGDQRRTTWTAKLGAGGTDYYYPFKYKVRTGSPLTEYSVLFRLSEQYLIRAEASARLGEIPIAISDIDVVRTRAGLSKIGITDPGISQPLLLEALLQERKAELFTEWNHRWVDLQRFGKATAVLPLVKPDWKPHVLLLPIPNAELSSNPSLVQNPGYQ